MKSRRMRWDVHVAQMDRKDENAYKNLVQNLKGRDRLEELDVDGKIMVK
jgi:hypothetical protein